MHPHATLIARFYIALAKRDGETMAACYHPDVHFQDPVFDLRGERASDMWRMLCARGHDLTVASSGIRADDEAGKAHWEATYTFSQTGRTVRNSVDAAFTFQDGLIHTHRDRFGFWRWSRQALGLPGLLLGGTPWLHNKVTAEAQKGLDRFVAVREPAPV